MVSHPTLRTGRYRDAEHDDVVNLLGDEFLLAREADAFLRRRGQAGVVMPRDPRHDPDDAKGAFNNCEGVSACGVIQVEPFTRGEHPKCVDLCTASNAGCIVTDPELFRDEVGLYKLNSVDPQLESAWFQPFAFKRNFK